MSKSHPSEVAVRPRWSLPSSGGGGGLCEWPGFSGIIAQRAGGHRSCTGGPRILALLLVTDPSISG